MRLRLTLPLLICLGAIAVAYFAWMQTEPVVPAGVGGSADETGDGRAGLLRTGPLTGRDELGRTDPGDDEASHELDREPTDLRRIIVCGRCLDAVMSSPLAGCEIVAMARAERMRNRRRNQDQEPSRFRAVGRSRPDGRFEFEVEIPGRSSIELRVRVAGYADMAGRLVVASGKALAGDILMPNGANLVGRVQDESGVLLPDVGIRFYRQLVGKQPSVHPINWLTLSSDATGAFASVEQLACGSWSLRPAGEGVRLIEPAANLEITQGRTTQQVTVVVRLPDPEAMISGQVVDADGKPVAQVVVHARDPSKWPIGYGYSKADGRFTVRCRKAPGEPVSLEIPRADGFEPLLSSGTYAWGTEDVDLVLQRTPDLRIAVTEANSTAPVEAFQVVWFQVFKPGDSTWQNRQLPARHYPGGKAVVEGIPSGPVNIVIVPTDQRLAPSDPLEVVSGSDQPEFGIELQQRVGLEVRVTDGGGRPVAGTVVELLRPAVDVSAPAPAPVTLATRVFEHRNYAQRAHRSQGSAIRLDRNSTNEAGRVTLGWMSSATPLAVRVLGPGHIPQVRDGIVLGPEGARIDITVNSGATLTGLVGPLDVLQQLRSGKGGVRWRGLGPRIVLAYQGAGGGTGGGSGQPRHKTGQIDAEGRFEIQGLLPGRWEVQFTATRFANGRGANIGTKTLGTVDLTTGTSQRVRYDISDLRIASLRGRVLFDGRPAIQTGIQLTRIAKAGRRVGTTIVLRTDDHGSFLAEDLVPGRYTVSVQAKGAGRRGPRLTSSTIVEVLPGADVLQDFHVQTGHLRVQIVYPDGTPAANRYLQIRGLENGYTAARQTDTSGLLEITPIGVGVYVVSAHKVDPKAAVDQKAKPGIASRWGATHRGASTEIGRITVAAALAPGSSPTPVRLTLPSK